MTLTVEEKNKIREEKLDAIINTLTLAFYEAKASSVCKKHCGNALVKLREFRENHD